MMTFKTLILSNRRGFKVTPWRITVPKAVVEKRPTFGNYVFDVADADLSIESGPDTSRMTVTRILGGGALLGPVGILLGGLARKDTTWFALAIRTPEVDFRVEFDRGEWRAAREFVAAVVHTRHDTAAA